MSLRLERIPGAPLVRATLVRAVLTVALAAAMLALLPAAAGAQTEDARTPSVVVRPGDSLWSISQERLGPDATPQRVADATERIHALNRERIGADPNLVLVGQELSIPRAMSGPPNGVTVPAHKAAEAPGSVPSDRAAKGAAVKEAPREASGQGAVPRSEASLREDAEMLGADREALPDQRAVAPVPVARTVALDGARSGSFFGVFADARAEGRFWVLGLGILALTPGVAALLVACVRGAARREARKREQWFRETYGRPYAASEPSASREDAPGRVPEAPRRTAYHDGPTNEGVALEDLPDLMDPFVLARAKQTRVRRQPPQLRARGPRRPARTWAQRKASSGRRRATARAIRKEWEPAADLVGALKGLTLRPGAGRGENLAGLKPLLGEALGALERLERRRGLSGRETTRRDALRALRAAIERTE